MEELARLAGVRLVHVPYQGMIPAQRDLLGGHIDMMIDLGGNSLPLIKDGKLKVLAVTGKARMSQLEHVPTVAETLADFSFVDWFAVMAPPGTPPAIADKLSQAMAEALRLPDVAKTLDAFAVTAIGGSPAETAAFVKREREHWRQVIGRVRSKAQ